MNENEILDYIKKETQNIPVPDSLSPEQVEKKLSGTKQKKFIHYRKRAAVLATAACLFLILIAGFATWPYLFTDSVKKTIVPEKIRTTAPPETKTTYQEVCNQINDYYSHREEIDEEMDMDVAENYTDTAERAETSGEDTSKMSEGNNTAAADYSDTDVQVQGVMEGDIVKTDGTYLYTVRSTTTGYQVTIYLADGAKTKVLSTIKVGKSDCDEMYLQENQLILIGNAWADITDTTPKCGVEDSLSEEADYYRRPCTTTNILVYDISAPEKPKKISSLTQSGDFQTSRVSDGCLYTFTSHYVSRGEYKSDSPKDFVPQINGEAIAEENIQLLDKEGANEYLVMTSLKLDSPGNFCDTLTTLGGGDVFYVSNSHIYVTKSVSQFFWVEENTNSTIIAKYNYKDGKFSYHTRTQIKGMIKDSYYMHEYKGNFCFVYTRYAKRSSTNGLCIMDDKLRLLGEISDLGIGERIYASYYMDHMAYFVTYRETDPVFAVDISNPEKPALKSELKLPGFSSYLHSFGKGKLLGIGEQIKDVEAVKFSLFSIDENYQITESAKKILADDTFCIADSNHKAVFVDEERGIFGLTIEDLDNTRYMVYQFDKKKNIFKKMLSVPVKSELEEVRGIRIRNTFYVVDIQHGITAYDMNNWKKLR